jgi:hypothetical protein
VKTNNRIIIGLAVILAFIALMVALQFFFMQPQEQTSSVLDETFTKADLIYGPQNWKPYADPLLISPGNESFRLMFIDLNSLPPVSGGLRVNYSFNDLPGKAAFHVYGFSNLSGLSWTNRVDGSGSSGYYVEASPGVPEQVSGAQTGEYIKMANDNGAKFDQYGNDTYRVAFSKSGGGLNKLHITVDPAVSGGQVTTTGNMSGTFYVTNTGDAGFNDLILMVAVSGPVPDDFSLRITV